MNVEINFIDKQPKKYIVSLTFCIVFFILLASTVTLLIVQKNKYSSQIDSQKNNITQMETKLLEQQKEIAGEQNLFQLQKDMAVLEDEMIPNVGLYKLVLGLLSTSNQLKSYQFNGTNQLVVLADFPTLDNVATYVKHLLEQEFIIDTQLTTITDSSSGYQATLTIDLDKETLVKEFGENE